MAKTPADGEDAVAGRERNYGVDARLMLPETSELLLDQECDMRVGKSLTQSLQCGRAHHRITQPIDAANEHPARVRMGWFVLIDHFSILWPSEWHLRGQRKQIFR